MPSDPHRREPIARRCAVLAGGRGRRMGGEKALIEVGGRPLIEHALAIAREADLRPLVVAKPETDVDGVGADVLREPEFPEHPLHGLATALRATGEPLVVCPCDTPLLPAQLLRELARWPGDCVVIEVDGRLQPLIGRYPEEAAQALAEAAARGASATATALSLAPVILGAAELAAFGDAATFTTNANTPEEIAALEGRLGGDRA